MRFQFHVVRRRHDLGLDRALEIRDFLGPLVNEQHHRVDFRMVRGDGVANLLEDGRLARARRRDDQAARALADGRDEVNDARLDQVRCGFQLEFLNRVNARQVLEADGLGIILERHVVDLVHGLELGLVPRCGGCVGPSMRLPSRRKLRRMVSGVTKMSRRLGMKMVLRGAQKAESLLGDFEIATAVIGLVAIILRITHKMSFCRSRNPSEKIAGKVNFGNCRLNQQQTRPSTAFK